MQKFDEMYTQLPYEFFTQGMQIRDHYKIYDEWLARQPGDMMAKRREEAELIFRRVGITFAVYGEKDEDGAGTERLIPFDLIPRVIPAHEWASMEKGLVQRVTALNRFSALTRCTSPFSRLAHSCAGMMRGIRSNGISRSLPAPSSSLAP